MLFLIIDPFIASHNKALQQNAKGLEIDKLPYWTSSEFFYKY